MKNGEHLWAVAYDDMERANRVRDEIVRLGWDEQYLILNDVAVVVRHLDGSFTLDRERFPSAANVLGCSPRWASSPGWCSACQWSAPRSARWLEAPARPSALLRPASVTTS